MGFAIHCPGCGREMTADPATAGMTADCPDCGAEFIIPGGEASAGPGANPRRGSRFGIAVAAALATGAAAAAAWALIVYYSNSQFALLGIAYGLAIGGVIRKLTPRRSFFYGGAAAVITLAAAAFGIFLMAYFPTREWRRLHHEASIMPAVTDGIHPERLSLIALAYPIVVDEYETGKRENPGTGSSLMRRDFNRVTAAFRRDIDATVADLQGLSPDRLAQLRRLTLEDYLISQQLQETNGGAPDAGRRARRDYLLLPEQEKLALAERLRLATARELADNYSLKSDFISLCSGFTAAWIAGALAGAWMLASKEDLTHA